MLLASKAGQLQTDEVIRSMLQGRGDAGVAVCFMSLTTAASNIFTKTMTVTTMDIHRVSSKHCGDDRRHTAVLLLRQAPGMATGLGRVLFIFSPRIQVDNEGHLAIRLLRRAFLPSLATASTLQYFAFVGR